MKDYKTAIIPVVTVACLMAAAITHHPVSASVQDEIASIVAVVVAGAISVWGIIKNHKKGA